MHKCCPTHGDVMVPRVNPVGGGKFLGCPRFATGECRVTWCFEDQSWHGLPEVVARASSKRGVVISLRARCEARLKALKEDPQEWFAAMGVDEIARLIQVA